MVQQIYPILPVLIRPLQSYSFPGNVRELRSIVERFFILLDPSVVGDAEAMAGLMRECIGDFPLPVAPDRFSVQAKETLEATLADVERTVVIRALQESGGDKSQAAVKLGMSRTTLYRRMAKLGLEG